MGREIVRVSPEFLKHLYDTYQAPVSEEKCPTCNVNPMSTAPWGQCRDCIIAEGRPTSLGDTTGETTNGEEGMNWNRNLYDN